MTTQEELELYKCFSACLSNQVVFLWKHVCDYQDVPSEKELDDLMKPYEEMREKLKIGGG